jgi:hypothetical protein
MFKILNNKEQVIFRKRARDIYKPSISKEIPETYHPVMRDECYSILIEYLCEFEDTDEEIENLMEKRKENRTLMQRYICSTELKVSRGKIIIVK